MKVNYLAMMVQLAIDNGDLTGENIKVGGEPVASSSSAQSFDHVGLITYSSRGWSNQCSKIGGRRSYLVDEVIIPEARAAGTPESVIAQVPVGVVGRFWQRGETAGTFVANDPTRLQPPSEAWQASTGLIYSGEELEQAIANLGAVDRARYSDALSGHRSADIPSEYRGQPGRTGHIQFQPGWGYENINDAFGTPRPGAVRVPLQPRWPDSFKTAAEYSFKDEFGVRTPVQGKSYRDHWVMDLWWECETDEAWARFVRDWLRANGSKIAA